MRDKERLQFDFTPEAIESLDKLKEKSGASTRAEVLRDALKAYEWMVDEFEKESTITVSKGDEVLSKFKAWLLVK